MDIRIRIDELRKQRGMTRLELAAKLDISYTALKNWYNQQDSMPSLKTIYRVCNIFNISAAELFADTETDNLSADQIAWLELYDKLPSAQKSIILTLAKSLIHCKDK